MQNSHHLMELADSFLGLLQQIPVVTFHRFQSALETGETGNLPVWGSRGPDTRSKKLKLLIALQSPTDFHPAFHMAVAFIPVIAMPAALIEGGSLYLILDAREVVIDLQSGLWTPGDTRWE